MDIFTNCDICKAPAKVTLGSCHGSETPMIYPAQSVKTYNGYSNSSQTRILCEDCYNKIDGFIKSLIGEEKTVDEEVIESKDSKDDNPAELTFIDIEDWFTRRGISKWIMNLLWQDLTTEERAGIHSIDAFYKTFTGDRIMMARRLGCKTVDRLAEIAKANGYTFVPCKNLINVKRYNRQKKSASWKLEHPEPAKKTEELKDCTQPYKLVTSTDPAHIYEKAAERPKLIYKELKSLGAPYEVCKALGQYCNKDLYLNKDIYDLSSFCEKMNDADVIRLSKVGSKYYMAIKYFLHDQGLELKSMTVEEVKNLLYPMYAKYDTVLANTCKRKGYKPVEVTDWTEAELKLHHWI